MRLDRRARARVISRPGEDARPDAVEDELEDAEVEAVEARGHLRRRSRALPGDDLPRAASPRSFAMPPREAARARDRGGRSRAPRAASGAPAPARCAPRGRGGSAACGRGAARADRRPRAGASATTSASAISRPSVELRLPAVPDVREEPLRLARRVLHAVEQRRDARLAPPVAGAAPHDRERHEDDRPLARRARRATTSRRKRGPKRASASARRRRPATAWLRRKISTGEPLATTGRSTRRRATARIRHAARSQRNHSRDRPPPDRRHAGREARERQALAQQDGVHEQVVDRRAVAHDVDERAAGGASCADALDRLRRACATKRSATATSEPRERAEARRASSSARRRRRGASARGALGSMPDDLATSAIRGTARSCRRRSSSTTSRTSCARVRRADEQRVRRVDDDQVAYAEQRPRAAIPASIDAAACCRRATARPRTAFGRVAVAPEVGDRGPAPDVAPREASPARRATAPRAPVTPVSIEIDGEPRVRARERRSYRAPSACSSGSSTSGTQRRSSARMRSTRHAKMPAFQSTSPPRERAPPRARSGFSMKRATACSAVVRPSSARPTWM